MKGAFGSENLSAKFSREVRRFELRDSDVQTLIVQTVFHWYIR